MKKNFLAGLVLSLTLTGCGVTQQLARDCGGDFKSLCRDVFGGSVDAEQDARLDSVTQRIAVLETQLAETRAQGVVFNMALVQLNSLVENNWNSVTAELAQLNTAVEDLQEQVSPVSALGQSLAALQARLEALETKQGLDDTERQAEIQAALADFTVISQTLQTGVASALSQIAVLQGYTNIISVKDPCGKQGSVINEVFLKLSTGKFLASVSENSSGKNTRFAVLEDGNFVTSDGTSCQFTVSNSGTVISNEHN